MLRLDCVGSSFYYTTEVRGILNQFVEPKNSLRSITNIIA